MANTLTVDWSEVSNLGKNTLINSADFETARQNFLDLVYSLPEWWEGDDADEFIANASSFLTTLKKDTLYFEALGKYYDHSSSTYNRVVDEHEKRAIRVNQQLEDEAGKFNLVPDDVVGGSNV